MFKTGTVLVLISEASGKSLRIMQDGDAEGKGGEGTLGIDIIRLLRNQILLVAITIKLSQANLL